MYIVAIAWMYVALLMAAAEPSLVAGVLSLTFYGILPLALLLWLLGGPRRRRAAPASRHTPAAGDDFEQRACDSEQAGDRPPDAQG